MSADPRAAIERLLAQPATPDALATWAARESPELASPYESLYRVVMASWTLAPGRALAAARHAIAGANVSALAPGDAGFLHHLDANTRLATGHAAEALAPYRLAWDAFRLAKLPEEAGRVAVGWSFACATTGNATEAARVVARGRRVLPASDVVGRARLANNLGTAWHLSGRLERARPEYHAAERTFRRAKEPAMAAACRYNSGLVETLEGRYAAARKDLEAARSMFRRLGVALHASYADVGLAELDLHQGRWDRGVESIRTLRDRFRELGDERAIAWLQRELARLFTTIGARAAAAPEARAARRSFARLGLAPEAANVAFLEGRLALETGALSDAFTRLREAEAHWDRAGNVRARARAGVEIARVRLAAGHPGAALEALAGPRRILTRLDPRGDGAIARGVAARCLLAEGRARRALALAREAYAAARRHPANLERPRLAILVADAAGRAGDSPGAVRWARRAVRDLETLLTRFGQRHLRALIGDAREPVYSTAVDLVLEHGGPRAATRAVDLLAQA
ncbi:MAG: hypothetical protein KC591_15270, partial [Gemmatimonadetes bacterium]|nr:hypothetical protein [Gemmatimonadota bacterium]